MIEVDSLSIETGGGTMENYSKRVLMGVLKWVVGYGWSICNGKCIEIWIVDLKRQTLVCVR